MAQRQGELSSVRHSILERRDVDLRGKKMKKLITLAIVLTIALTVVTCGGGTGTPTVTFDGGKCRYDGPKKISADKFTVNFNVENRDREKYGLYIVTLDQGKTLADLDAWPSTDPPPWVYIVAGTDVGPGSRSEVTVDMTKSPQFKSPIFLVCLSAPPEAKITTMGPVEVGQ